MYIVFFNPNAIFNSLFQECNDCFNVLMSQISNSFITSFIDCKTISKNLTSNLNVFLLHLCLNSTSLNVFSLVRCIHS